MSNSINIVNRPKRRPQIVEDADAGLERGEFFFMLQPRLRTPDARICGFEALLRWRHPQRGMLKLSSFISVVEESDLTYRFTDHVLESACDLLAQWSLIGWQDIVLSVNCSVRQLTDGNFVKTSRQMLARHEVPPHGRQIELTDVSAPSQFGTLIRAIEELESDGISVALGNFGSGSMSLTLLHQLPADAEQYSARRGSQNSCRDTHSPGPATRKKIVVEGIETKAQFNWVKAFPNVDFQGFFISMTLSSDCVDKFVTYRRLGPQPA